MCIVGSRPGPGCYRLTPRHSHLDVPQHQQSGRMARNVSTKPHTKPPPSASLKSTFWAWMSLVGNHKAWKAIRLRLGNIHTGMGTYLHVDGIDTSQPGIFSDSRHAACTSARPPVCLCVCICLRQGVRKGQCAQPPLLLLSLIPSCFFSSFEDSMACAVASHIAVRCRRMCIGMWQRLMFCRRVV